jgi:hypothetical protein
MLFKTSLYLKNNFEFIMGAVQKGGNYFSGGPFSLSFEAKKKGILLAFRGRSVN